MAKVLGVGGVFFKVAAPQRTRDWYDRVLGMKAESWGGIGFAHPDRGAVVWGPFKSDTKYFEPSQAPFMVNFIVDDLNAMLEHVKAEGETVLGRDDSDSNGRFAWVMDPDGIKIELWEPTKK